MSRLSRIKGKVWEREVARMFRAYFKRGALVRRGHQTRSGRDGADVEGTPFWIECKHQRACSPEAALRQAEEAASGAKDARTPIAVCKTHGSAHPFVAIRLDRFLALVGLAFQTPHDPHDLLAGLRPVDLRELVAEGTLLGPRAQPIEVRSDAEARAVLGDEGSSLFDTATTLAAARGKSTLLARATRMRRPR